MRTLVSLAVLIALTTAPAVLAEAQTGGSPAANDKQTAKTATSRNVSGTVRSAVPDAIVVSGRDKGKDAEWTFAVEPTTNIRKGSKSITAGDIKPGDAVQVRYVERDGKALARSILVKDAKKEPAKPASK